MSRLDLVVGPNGAGKSTFVEFVLADLRRGVAFVNADVIAAERWPHDPVGHGHEAAAAAERIRDELLRRGEPFIAGTVASNPQRSIWSAELDKPATTFASWSSPCPKNCRSSESPCESPPAATTSPSTRSGSDTAASGTTS